MKGFFNQLWVCIIRKNGYPHIDTFGYWEFRFVNNECRYNQWKTLLNYITDKKTKRWG